MPRYEYRCRICQTTFELRRAVNDADSPTECPDGHDDVTRLLSVFATARVGQASGPAVPAGAPCGPACACHPG
jgi:putative FmdB family regulatory protein